MGGPNKNLVVHKAEEKKVGFIRKNKDEFKVPLPPVRKKKILDEETYVNTMEHIIRRDFYPDLHNVIASEDLDRLGTPGVTPRGTPGGVTPGVGTPAGRDTPLSQRQGRSFEEDTPRSLRDEDPIDRLDPRTMTPARSVRSDATGASSSSSLVNLGKRKRAKDMSLDKFCATHTSEDNASFQDILAKDRLKQSKKYWWLKEKDVQGKRMALIGNGDSTSTGRIKYWDYKNKNSLMYVPDGHNSANLNFKPKKKTVAANTRFPGSLEEQVVQEYIKVTKAPTPAQRPPSGTPIVRGYKLMRTPSPSPSAAGGATPIITWGNLASTPLHIKEEDPVEDIDNTTKASVFKVPEMPLRERIGLKLGDSVRMKRATKKRNRTPKPTPVRTPSGSRIVDLSPAAIRLLRKRQRSSRKRSDSQLRASYKSPRLPPPSSPARL